MAPHLPRVNEGPPLVYAHRGGAALRPENTIEAFDHGISLGADGLEFDVHLTRDGLVVVHHDSSLQRTTSGRGSLCALTAEELRQLDAAYWFQSSDSVADRDERGYPFRGRGFTIPLLRDVLRRYRDAHFIIELKVRDPELARRTVAEVRAADAVDRVSIGSFSLRALNAARRSEPGIRTGASQEETRWALYRSWVGWPLGRTAYSEFQVPERSGTTTIVTPRFVTYAHRAGLPVKVWTVNTEDDMRRLLDWGVDALITDRPDLAKRVVESLQDT